MQTPAHAPITLIIAATDLSPAANRAVAKAAMLAVQWGAELGRATAPMDEQLAQLGAATRIEPVLAYGTPAAVLLDQADRIEADLIVIGKHGGTALEERLLASVTQNVLYHARCDILQVP